MDWLVETIRARGNIFKKKEITLETSEEDEISEKTLNQNRVYAAEVMNILLQNSHDGAYVLTHRTVDRLIRLLND